MTKKRIVSGLLVVVLVSCSDGVGLRPSLTDIVPGAAAVLVGDTIRLAVHSQTSGNGAGTNAVLWSTSDPEVATVNAAGLVTGRGEGTAWIVAQLNEVSQVASVQVWDPPTVNGVEVTAAGDPLLRTLSASLGKPANIEVDYWLEGEDRLRIGTAEPAADHNVLVARLLPGSTYDYEVRSVGPMGLRGPISTGTFTSDTLPTRLSEVDFEVTGETSRALTMLELRALNFVGFVIVDRKGRVVWYWETDGSPQGSTRRDNGNFVFVDRGRGLIEVSPAKTVVSEVTGPMDPLAVHHDVVSTPDNTVLFLTLDAERTVNDTTWVGDRIWEWDPDLDLVAVRWDTFDFYDIVADRRPRSRPDDWGHANAISFGPRNNIIMSFHWLNQIISIAPDYQSIEWKLGGLGSDFELDTTDAFSGQHTGAEVSPGHILLFDNGFEREGTPDEYSRALELELDFDAGRATRAWEFRPTPDQFSRIISSARRLPNGNTLTMFGFRTAVPLTAYEAAPDGSTVWSLEVHAATTSSVYRANAVDHVAGESAVTPPPPTE